MGVRVRGMLRFVLGLWERLDLKPTPWWVGRPLVNCGPLDDKTEKSLTACCVMRDVLGVLGQYGTWFGWCRCGLGTPESPRTMKMTCPRSGNSCEGSSGTWTVQTLRLQDPREHQAALITARCSQGLRCSFWYVGEWGNGLLGGGKGGGGGRAAML